jgi:hypothetical protein
MLTLAEELLLLGLRDEQGTVASSASLALRYGLQGAIMADLLLQNRLRLDEKGRVELVSETPTGDELLDEALAAVAHRNRPRPLKDWVMSSARSGGKGAQARLSRRLVERGVLREEEGRFLWLFPTHHFPAIDPRPESDVRERVRRVVLQGSAPDERTLVLLSLIKACKLTNEAFRDEDRTAAKARIDELTRGEAAGHAVAKAVAAVQAAVMAAVIASTTAAAASTTSS